MQQQTHPKVSEKKWATGQSCIRKRSTTFKIGTLAKQKDAFLKLYTPDQSRSTFLNHCLKFAGIVIRPDIQLSWVFVRVIYAWLDGYKSFLCFYALFFLNILMLCNRNDFYQLCKTDNFIISDKNRWFILAGRENDFRS